MTALEDAARAVERAQAALLRELASPTEWIGGEYGCDEREAQRLVNTLTAAVRHHDAEILRAEADRPQKLDESLSGSRFRRTQFRKAADHIEPKDAP